MVKKATRSVPPARPYYVPASIDYDALPEAVKLVFEAVIEPTYRQLVLGVTTALERSAGITMTFLLSVEVLDQFEIGQQLNFAVDSAAASGPERDRLIARYLRVVGAKQHAEKFLFRLHEVRAKHDMVNDSGRSQ